MATANEKFLEILKLLNNCREKLNGLYGLFEANVNYAKEDSRLMGQEYDNVSICHDELKQISKEKANGKAKSSRLIVKAIMNRLNSAKVSFEELYLRFSSALDECIPLRREYKSEVKACCDTYNQIKAKNEVSASIDKGYRAQVRIIQAILEKIKNLIASYTFEKEIVEERKMAFNQTCNVSEVLATSI